jgi:GNAT superfamily N-acetyltransferase
VTEIKGVSCTATGFNGFEQEILRLRNRNRTTPETTAYLRWRYEVAHGTSEPCVFWLFNSAGDRIGMAAAIFRWYRMNGVRVQVAVIGDISIESEWRNRGLGQLLLRYLTEYLDVHFPQTPALVIPTESARRALDRVGWSTAGTLVPSVYVLDPSRYLERFVPVRTVARVLTRLAQSMQSKLLLRRLPMEAVLELATTLGPDTIEFLGTRDCPSGAARDMTVAALDWRYGRHPHTRFTFGTFKRSLVACGFVVFEDNISEETCSVYDLLARDRLDMREMLALLVQRCRDIPQLASLRVLLDARHPARRDLRSLGFIDRSSTAVFQVRYPAGTNEKPQWRISLGDKDT